MGVLEKKKRPLLSFIVVDANNRPEDLQHAIDGLEEEFQCCAPWITSLITIGIVTRYPCRASNIRLSISRFLISAAVSNNWLAKQCPISGGILSVVGVESMWK